MRRLAPTAAALVVAALVAIPGTAVAKGGGGGGGGGGATTPPPCTSPSISLPKPVEAFNVAGKTDLTVQLTTRISSCGGGAYVVDVVEITGPDPATALPGSPYPGCAFDDFTVGSFTLRPGESRTFNWTTPPLKQRVCTHWLQETLRDPVTGESWGPVVQRLDHTSRI